MPGDLDYISERARAPEYFLNSSVIRSPKRPSASRSITRRAMLRRPAADRPATTGAALRAVAAMRSVSRRSYARLDAVRFPIAQMQRNAASDQRCIAGVSEMWSQRD
jgi:hypothetical protein